MVQKKAYLKAASASSSLIAFQPLHCTAQQ
jgi:hypothetical protein